MVMGFRVLVGVMAYLRTIPRMASWSAGLCQVGLLSPSLQWSSETADMYTWTVAGDSERLSAAAKRATVRLDAGSGCTPNCWQNWRNLCCPVV